jgi:radical SAM protein with 4Fe4S-binding SPASM domain
LSRRKARSPEGYFDEVERRLFANCIPFRSIVELTYSCNFNCVHCYRCPDPARRELSFAETKDLLDDLAGLGCLTVTFSGGEATLRKDFIRIARYARSRRFAFRLFTNGSRIDAHLASELASLNPLSVDVSLLGDSPDTYEAVTGRAGNFQATISGIRNLLAENITVVLKMPVLAENASDIPGVEKMAGEWGLPVVLDPNISPRDDGSLAPLEHELSPGKYRAFLEHYSKPVTHPRRKPGNHVCNAGRSGVAVSPYGDVFPCIQLRKSAGNVREEKLSRIWSGSPVLREIRELRMGDLESCVSCSKNRACDLCPGIFELETGDIRAPAASSCRRAHVWSAFSRSLEAR